jgi:hypothetical protein
VEGESWCLRSTEKNSDYLRLGREERIGRDWLRDLKLQLDRKK